MLLFSVDGQIKLRKL